MNVSTEDQTINGGEQDVWNRKAGGRRIDSFYISAANESFYTSVTIAKGNNTRERISNSVVEFTSQLLVTSKSSMLVSTILIKWHIKTSVSDVFITSPPLW